MVSNDKAGYKRGYEDGKRDARNGMLGFNFSGLPEKYAQGYRAGQRDAAVHGAKSKAFDRLNW